MRTLDYEAFLFSDAILFPALLAVVFGIFALAAYYDMSRCQGSNSQKFWDSCAFVIYLVTSILLVVRLTLDMWRLARTMEGEPLESWLQTLDTVCGYAFSLFFLLAVPVTIWCMWLRFQRAGGAP